MTAMLEPDEIPLEIGARARRNEVLGYVEYMKLEGFRNTAGIVAITAIKYATLPYAPGGTVKRCEFVGVDNDGFRWAWDCVIRERVGWGGNECEWSEIIPCEPEPEDRKDE
jgi:hypothetical protein